ncbi:MAG TPA: hypothetical protein PLH72_14955 [Vicinamibacterales bacterium]|nr:hypothetical protein [Vicinamibacterales bacterium]
MPELALSGLDGSNPLGFLAALGVLDAVSGDEHAALWWRYEAGWNPVLASSCQSVADLVARLDQDRQSCITDPALALAYDGKRDLKPPPAVFVGYLRNLVDASTMMRRRSVDWAAAFATDVAVDNNGNTKPTALHFTAGQQQFLQMVQELVKHVTAEDLTEAVFEPWRYSRPLPVMGWDATSSRDYALRATDPSTDKKLGVPGADWLAIRGLSFIPAVPRGTRVVTTCCSGGWKDGQFTWPLWTVGLTSPVIRSLLAQQVDQWSMPERRSRGIGVVLSSGIKRSEQGGYGSFEPSISA